MADTFVQQLYKRKIFRISAAYLAVAWMLWQVVGTTCPAFECSAQFQQSIFWFLITGLPVTVAIAWLNWKTAILVGSGLLAGAAAMFFVLRGPTVETEDAARSLDEASQSSTEQYPELKENFVEAPEAATNRNKTSDFDGRPAVAVLPFVNLSSDPDQAFFADGLAEDLITRLSSWRAFPVIARNSSFKYRDENMNLVRVSAELGVQYIVEGSVRRNGNRIRIAAQLIDGASGEHIWAETYDRAVTDVFALQDEISAIITASLVGDLMRAEGERAHQRGTENLEAWSLYQLGLQSFDRYTLHDFADARRLFGQAAGLDSRFATALGQLAITGYSEIILGYDGPRAELVNNMMTSARRAVQLDSRDPAAHLGLAGAYLARSQIKNAIESIERAIDLNPSMPDAWIWLGFTQILAGNPEITISATTRAQRLNPQGAMVWIYDNFALGYWELGRYEEALEAARRLVAAQPTYFPGYAYIAMNAVALGRLEEARSAINEGRRVRPDLSLTLMQNYFGVSRPTIDKRRNDALRMAGLEQ